MIQSCTLKYKTKLSNFMKGTVNTNINDIDAISLIIMTRISRCKTL